MFQRILVPVDGSITATYALHRAIEIALVTGAVVKAITVIDTMRFQYGIAEPDQLRMQLRLSSETLIKTADALFEKAGIVAVADIMESGPAMPDIASVIFECAKAFNADLVVMGTHGRRGFRRMLTGSVAQHFLRMSECPVLLMRRPTPDNIDIIASSDLDDLLAMRSLTHSQP